MPQAQATPVRATFGDTGRAGARLEPVYGDDAVMIWPNLGWWIVDAGTHRQQWARLQRDGKVGIYDARGKLILKTKYRHRFQARAALRRRGFRRWRRRDGVQPPSVS